MLSARTVITFMFVFEECTAADPFLQKQQKTSLLEDIEAVLGQDSIGSRLDKLKTRLQPMFLSLPHMSTDLVSHAAARYALHRITVDLHRWRIAGLEPTPDTFNTTSLHGTGMHSLLPPHIADIIEAHIGSGGFGLRDLAIVASTIVHHVHDGQIAILRKACELIDLPTVGPMDEKSMMRIIALYKAAFLRGIGVDQMSTFSPEKLERMMSLMTRTYPGWVETMDFVSDQRQILVFNKQFRSNPFVARESSLDIAIEVVGQVADHFSTAQAEPECQEIKEDLLAYELADSGRIRLVDFYRAGLNSRFFYTETKEYLEAIGAIDDTDAWAGPKVMVPNYVLAKSNCLAETPIYSVCCYNECEGLFGQLEESFAAPDASADQIAHVVSGLSSSTVQGPRNLSETILRRLQEIALANGGRVLLHGRLFAQLMHSVFPRECPYPHMTGTTTSLGTKEWSASSGQYYRIDQGQSNKTNVLEPHIQSL